VTVALSIAAFCCTLTRITTQRLTFRCLAIAVLLHLLLKQVSNQRFDLRGHLVETEGPSGSISM